MDIIKNYEKEGYKCLSPSLRENPKGFVEALKKNLNGLVVGFGDGFVVSSGDGSIHADQTWLTSEMEVHGFRLVEEKVSSSVTNMWGEYTEEEMTPPRSEFKTVYTLYALVNEDGAIERKRLCKLDIGEYNAYLFWHEPSKRYAIGLDVDCFTPCWEVCFEVKRRAFETDDKGCAVSAEKGEGYTVVCKYTDGLGRVEVDEPKEFSTKGDVRDYLIERLTVNFHSAWLPDIPMSFKGDLKFCRLAMGEESWEYTVERKG